MYDAKHMTSPIRYPGGKFRHMTTLLPFFLKMNLRTMVSPFFGGGGLELNLAVRGVEVIGSDICPQITNFWCHFLTDPRRIYDDADAKIRHQYDELKAGKYAWVNRGEYEGYKDALLYLCYNRLAFGGKIQGSYMKDFVVADCGELQVTDNRGRRVLPYDSTWERLHERVSVERRDFVAALNSRSQEFAYCDPPYVGTENLYNTKTFNHLLLHELLTSRDNWVLSYSDKPEVRELYADYHFFNFPGISFATGKYSYDEVLIFSHDRTPANGGTQLQLF